jgi:integrase
MATVIRRKDSPNWFARFQVDGQDYTVSTGTTNKRDAEKAMRRMLAEKKGAVSVTEWFDGLMKEFDKQTREATSHVRQSELLAMRHDMARQLMGAQAEKLALNDAWQAWLDNPKKRNPGSVTIEGYRSEWKRFHKWAQALKVGCLHEITPTMAEDYATDLWKSKVAPGTYNAHIKLLKALFKVLKTKAGLVANPWDEIPTFPPERESRRMLTAAELKNVCSTASGSLRYMIGLGLYTGMRLGDVVNLRWENVNLPEGFIEITPMKTRRTNKKVRVPIHPILAVLLTELQETSHGKHLFPEDRAGYQIAQSVISKRIQAFFELCKIETNEKPTNGHRRRAIIRVGFHSLRHSFVSLCAANRVPQVAIMELVGHGSPAMTALYSHAGDEQKAKAIAALPSFEFNQTGTQNGQTDVTEHLSSEPQK